MPTRKCVVPCAIKSNTYKCVLQEPAEFILFYCTWNHNLTKKRTRQNFMVHSVDLRVSTCWYLLWWWCWWWWYWWYDAVHPGDPEVSVDTSEQDMREGHTVQLSCTSTGGNPSPSLTWYRNGSPVTSSQVTVTSPTVKFGATVANLTWTLSSADHLANFSCSANNSESFIYSPIKYYHVQCKLQSLHSA